MTTRARSLLFPALIVGLVALAAFGVSQVMFGQEGPQFPVTDEERQRLYDEADAAARDAVQAFIDSGGNPCSVRLGELMAEFDAPYPGLDSLINDVDLIVAGRSIDNVLESPEPRTIGGRLLTTVEVDDVLYGAAPMQPLTVDYGSGVIRSGDLVRYAASGLDSCATGRVLLFLNRTSDPGVFSIGYQGWAQIETDALDAAPYNELFLGYTNAEALLADVRGIGQEQEAQGLLKGLLLCEFRRTSDTYLDPIVCPGDTFNPYQAFQLNNVREAFVVTTDPGPSPLALFRTDLEPGGAQLNALLATLDVEVTIEPAGVAPDDLISLRVLTAAPNDDRVDFSAGYSPSTGILQLTSSGGQFPASPEFQQAMAPFLAPQ